MKKNITFLIALAIIVMVVSCSQGNPMNSGTVNSEEAGFYIRANTENTRDGNIRNDYVPETGDKVIDRGDQSVFDPVNGFTCIIHASNTEDKIIMGIIDTTVDTLDSASDFPAIIRILGGNNYGVAYSFGHEMYEYPGDYSFEAIINTGEIILLDMMYQAKSPEPYAHGYKLYTGYFTGIHITEEYLPEIYGTLRIDDAIPLTFSWDGICDSTVVNGEVVVIPPELAPHMVEEINLSWQVNARTSYSNMGFMPMIANKNLERFEITILAYPGTYQNIIISSSSPYLEHFLGVNASTDFGEMEIITYLDYNDSTSEVYMTFLIYVDEDGVPRHVDITREWRGQFLGIVPNEN